MPLKVSDGIGAWIKDFQKSDAPQFKGKSKEDRRDQAVAAYLSAKRGDKKEGYMPNYADKMKKKMMTPSDKDKLMKIRQMLDKEKKPVKKEAVYGNQAQRLSSPLQKMRQDKEKADRDKDGKLHMMKGRPKKPVQKEAMTPAQKAAHDKAVADFKKRGGKITKLPPGKAAGYHGKDDPGSGIKGMLAKGTGTKYNIRNRGKHLDKDMNESMLGHSDAAKLNGGKSKDSNFNSPESHIDYHHRQSGGHKKSGGDQDRHRYQVAKKLGYKVESYNHMNEDVNVHDAHYDAQNHSNGSMSVKKVQGKPSLIMKSYHKEKDGHEFAKKHGYKASNYVKTFAGSRMHLHKESVQEDFMFKVGVEGLPDMIMLGTSPGDVKARLRKIVKQPSMVTGVDRMTKAEVRKRYRDMAKGKEATNESVLDKHV